MTLVAAWVAWVVTILVVMLLVILEVVTIPRPIRRAAPMNQLTLEAAPMRTRMPPARTTQLPAELAKK